MAKWAGKIGFSETVETSFDVQSEQITERTYYGDVTRNSRRWDSGQGINDNFVINNGISVVADDYMLTNLKYMRYVTWQGARWKIRDITIEYPRCVLTIGDLYNGKTPYDQ